MRPPSWGNLCELADTDRRVRTARGAELEEGNSCAGRAETPLPIVLRLAIRAVKGLDSSLDNGCALEASLFGHLRLDRRSHRVQRHVPGEVKAGISAWINKIGQSDEPALPAVSMNSRTPSA